MSQLSETTGLTGYQDPQGKLTGLATRSGALPLLVSADGTLAAAPSPFQKGDHIEAALNDVRR